MVIGFQVIIGAGQKQLAGILRPAHFLIQQVRHGLRIVILLRDHERAHEPDQSLVPGVSVLAGRVYILKRQRGVIELHLIKPRPGHYQVGVVGPVGARPVLNRHRRLLNDVVQVRVAGAHARAVQRRIQRQHRVIVVYPLFIQSCLNGPQLFAGNEVGVVAGRDVVE